jgi:exopolysaccharide biosynthesis polyprenyl glycosylphosphotransferase
MYSLTTALQPVDQKPGASDTGNPLKPNGTPVQSASWLWQNSSSELVFDLICFSAALLVVVFHAPITSQRNSLADILEMRISLVNLIMAAACIGLWSVLLRLTAPTGRTQLTTTRLVLGLNLRVAACTALLAVLLKIRHPDMANAKNLGTFCAISFTLLLCSRLLAGGYRTLIQPAIRKHRNVIIVGCGSRGQRVAQQLLLHPKSNYHLFGFVDTDPPCDSDRLIGTNEMLESILMENPIDEVIITLPVKSMYDEIQKVIAICENAGIQSQYSTDFFATHMTKRRTIDRHDPSSILLHMVHNETQRALKRVTDIVIAASALILLSPIMFLIAICIKLTSAGPCIFRQDRYGLNKRLFTMYKFRSMVVDAEQQQSKLEHLNESAGPAFKMKKDPRITGIGSFIRKTSLDELPQLWNVLVGDMSIVGPRPLPIRDVSRFSEAWLMRRFSVPPGITGLWQVSGRSNTSFAHWIRLDLDYIDRWTLLLDFQIIAKTLPAVLKREGAV